MDRMEIKPTGALAPYTYVVIFSFYQGKLLLSRHRSRDTWETQGGHVEKGETPMEAARRELYEESGAAEYQIKPLFDYFYAKEGTHGASGQIFLANITRLEPLPPMEMAEIRLFDCLPQNVTYPAITPYLYEKIQPYL